MSDNFKLPAAFVQASQARLAKIKERHSPNPDSASTHSRRLKDANIKQHNASESSTSKPSPSKTLAEIERIKAARERRRKVAEKIKVEREGKDELEIARDEYLKQINAFRKSLLKKRKKQSEEDSIFETETKDKITICIRKRPLNRKETNNRNFDILTARPSSHIYVHEPKVSLNQTRTITSHAFKFDRVFEENMGNDVVYETALRPLIDKLFDDKGKTVSLFCYGATGSGKTHTVFGADGGRYGSNSPENTGLYEYLLRDVFLSINHKKSSDASYRVVCSFFEIYSGKVHDLLNQKSRLQLLEGKDGTVQIMGLSDREISSVDEGLGLIISGNKSRALGSTEANSQSSRSHAIFRINLLRETEADKSAEYHSQIALIDLAGSERAQDVGKDAPKKSRIEGAAINKSLLALKECIRALHMKENHVPFRASKLTQVLRESFVGSNKDSHCVMIVNVAPTNAQVELTLSCLWYANRVKEFKTKRIEIENYEDSEDEAMLDKAQEEITGLGQSDLSLTTDNDDLDENDKSDSDDSVSEHEEPPMAASRNSSDIAHSSRPVIMNSISDNEQILLGEHLAVLSNIIELSTEEENLIARRMNSEVDLDDYVYATEVVLEDKIRSLKKLLCSFQHMKELLLREVELDSLERERHQSNSDDETTNVHAL